MSLKNTSFALACALLSSLSGRAAAADAFDLVGTWTWKIPETGCAMTRTFNADGSTTVVNGKKTTTGTWTLKSNKKDNSRMLLSTIATDDGGVDCDGTGEKTVGKRYGVYVITESAGLLMCFTPDRTACMGPYRRR
jgi:hypothetical protein